MVVRVWWMSACNKKINNELSMAVDTCNSGRLSGNLDYRASSRSSLGCGQSYSHKQASNSAFPRNELLNIKAMNLIGTLKTLKY